MKRFLLLCLTLLATATWSFAQTTVLDFETPGTSTTFQYFGSTLDGSLNNVIANPNPSGINTSSMVAEFIKPAGAEVWAGAYSNPDPTVLVDATSGQICVKVHSPNIGNLAVKLENSTTGGANWVITVPNTLVNEWEELCFDFTLPSEEAPFEPAVGNIYTRIVLFFDFQTPGGASDVTYYFDDVVTVPDLQETTILDFEDAPTSTVFQYFGSTLDGTFTSVIANPNASGINTSANVTEYIKPAGAEVWAGCYSNPDPTTLMDFTTAGQICVKVHMDHIGNLALKMENSTTGGPNWVTTVPNTLVNEWEEICFDVSLPSEEAPFEPAAGNIYTRLVLFFDFQTPGGAEDVTSYFDDIVVKGGGSGPQQVDATFRVDMNEYAGSFTTVYVSGSFNGWSGDSNPMDDTDGDGVWEVTLPINMGVIEYKFTLDNWAAQEEFNGLEECTITDPSGQFHNRKLTLSDDVELPAVCFNSCYVCGDEVTITFELGMGDFEPNADGVWLCGGGNFEAPGGRFKMEDPEGDDIYVITVKRQRGFESFFTFANGNCPDFSCKEDIAGQSCAQAQNFNDRLLPAVQQDTVLATCFGLCTDNSACITSTRETQIDDNLISIQPTLTTGMVQVQFNQMATGDKALILMNSVGQQLQQINLDGGVDQYELNLSHLSPGIYFVHARSGQVMTMKKVVKQ
jgi:hypothetical protein